MKDNLTLEQANAKLEIIVKKMENGELSLKESMDCYDEAFTLLDFCYKQLEDCKLRITDINDRINSLKSGDYSDE